jgi:hypothetical protein
MMASVKRTRVFRNTPGAALFERTGVPFDGESVADFGG